jgi:beta-lactamase class A
VRALFLFVSLVAICPVPAAEPTLTAKLKPHIDAHKGPIAVFVKNLETSEVFAHNADDVMPTASLIKTAIMVEAYWQAREKTIDLAKSLTLTKDDKVPGAGILTQHFSDGVTLPIKDCVRLMIVYSDNTATNMVLDQVGIAKVNSRMESLGLKNTKINAKVFKGSTSSVDPERTKKYGLGSTTARESVQLLAKIHHHDTIPADDCPPMLAHLKANDDHEMLVRFLPPGTVVAHKTGAVSNARTEAGIIYIPGAKDKKTIVPVAVAVLTNDIEDRRWVIDNASQLTIAKIGKEVYDYFHLNK